MNAVRLAVFAVLSSSALVAGAGDTVPVVSTEAAIPSALEVPGIMTPSGQKFVNLCSDAAFAKAADAVARSKRCERVLAEWRAEAFRRTESLADADTGKPAFLSLRGIPRYPSR